MKNIPRIFTGDNTNTGMIIPAGREIAHYLQRVMRTNQFLAFGGGNEFSATISDDGQNIIIGQKTEHDDPTGDITLMFAPVKRTDDLLNMATQMGVAVFQPVITERTVAQHINWERMQKIVTEASEQSNRNSVPKILPTKRFSELDLSGIAFADERAAHGRHVDKNAGAVKYVLVGPEGGFSDAEFAALDNAGAHGFSLGRTILRAELAAAVAVGRVME